MSEEEMKNQIEYIIEVVTEGNDYTLRYYDIQCIMRLLDLYIQEKEKNEELEKHQKQYLDGELITAKQGKFFEKMIKENYIRKDKLKAIQGELCMRLGSYVRDEASPEQERIAGGINIINKILKGE